jgi:hypothetical protein
MVIFVEQKSFAIISETFEEQSLDDRELRAKCLTKLKSMKGKIFVNKATGISIEVNREIHNELRIKVHVKSGSHRPLARIRFMVIKILPYLLTDSDPDELFVPDYRGRPHVEYSHLFKYNCKINGHFYQAKIRTRKIVGRENRLYFISFDDLEISEK